MCVFVCARTCVTSSRRCPLLIAGMLLKSMLRWRSLQFQSSGSAFQPRARHAAFCLEVLQPGRHEDDAARAGSGCLLVFGGIGAGGTWLKDLTLLALWDDGGGQLQPQALPVPYLNNCKTAGADLTAGFGIDGAGPCICNGPASATAAATATGITAAVDTVLQPLRDFAAATVSRNQFLVAGGFDGSNITMQLLLCELVRQPQDSNVESQHWPHGWAARWSQLAPRNAGPPGRCHHSLSYYGASSSVVVFGGYADGIGALEDVWLLHLGHLEWWRPLLSTACSGPCARRSHAAALLGHKLYVHGGRDANGDHLADLWCLDMEMWTWTLLCAGVGGRAACL